ncbi:hypothetical protein WA026_008775 [Henosepilachna vigintioctopunctata]|uniref:Uncharacterized protein n=1 Tax=Henosepilachna vigintioctopunctata TaxID=420089 RepID=A0AAW1VCE6_9CUCU
MTLQDPEESIYHNNTSSCISMCVFNDDVHDPDYDCDGESSEDDGETGYVSVSHQQKVSHGSSVDKKTSKEDKPNARINNVENESNYDNEEILSYENFRDNINNNEFNLQLITVNHNYLGVESSNHTTKKHFCIFCKTKQTKLARHFLNKHKDEADVVLFANLPVKNEERLSIISKLRKQGDAVYNSNQNYNKGDIIVVRRPQLKKNRNGEHYLPCSKCSAMYSILSLRAHHSKCSKMKNKFQRNVTVASRVKTFINLKANSIMRNKILPHMRVDTIGKLVRNEELIILFGNRLTQKYRSPHLYKMIRSRLRCVANFYWHYQQRNHQVQTFADLFDPQNYDEVVICINKMAGLNENSGQYKSPATAANSGTYLKKISLHLISEMIKSKNQIKLQVKEKNEVNKLFQKELKDNKLPSMAVCRKVIMENSILSNRTPEML